MALDRDLKLKIKTYFETHDDEPASVARMFCIKPATIYAWIKRDGWIRNSKSVDLKDIKDDLVNDAICSKLDATKKAVQEQIKDNFLKNGCRFDELEIKLATEDVLLKASSLKFIQSTMIEAGLVAKRELENTIFKAECGDKNAKNKVLTTAEKVVSIFGELQKNIHGKETPNVAVTINGNNNFSKESIGELSDDELIQIALGDTTNQNEINDTSGNYFKNE